jgi:hypothetical protein
MALQIGLSIIPSILQAEAKQTRSRREDHDIVLMKVSSWRHKGSREADDCQHYEQPKPHQSISTLHYQWPSTPSAFTMQRQSLQVEARWSNKLAKSAEG